MPHNHPIVELSEEYAARMERLADGADSDEELDALFAEFKTSEADRAEAFEQYARMDAMLQAQADASKAIAAQATKVRARYARQKDALRRYMLLALQTADEPNIKTALGTWHRTRNWRPVVDSLDAVPDELTTTTTVADVSKIRAAMKANPAKTIPGVHREDSESVALKA